MRPGLFENPSYHRPDPEPPSMAVGTLARQRVRVSTGDMAYLRHGSGPPLLLVHGIPTSARLWEPLLGDLGERYDCIVPDLLGMGESLPDDGAALDSPAQATVLAELLDALGVADVFATFHDQGGAHAIPFLRDHGDRVRALALCDVVCYDNWLVPAISFLSTLCRSPSGLRLLARAGLAEPPLLKLWPFPQTTVRGPLPTALVDDWMAALRTGGPQFDAYCRYIRAQSPRHTIGSESVLRSWTGPALVTWAGHDRFLPPSWGARLCGDLPGAPDQPVLLPFAGHFFHADVPRTAARVLGDFFASV